jgi:hypothetical protein
LSARRKLNVAAVNGAIVLGAIAGWATGSWAVFLLATAVLIATAWHSGAIRPARRHRSDRSQDGRL